MTETPLLDCSNITSLVNAFQACWRVKTIRLKNTHNVSQWNYSFTNASALITLETLDFSSAKSLPSNMLTSDVLENIKLVPNTAKVSFSITSKMLTAESIQSIIDGLAKVEEQQTLTLYSEVVWRLTEDQWSRTVEYNWYIA